MTDRKSLHDKLFDELHAIVVKEIKARDIKQMDLAKMAKVTPAFVCQILKVTDTQKRFLPSLVRLADALDIDLSFTQT